MPWSGFWAKAMASDVMLIMTNTQYVKGEYLNRVPLLNSWLTLEVINANAPMSEVRVSALSIQRMLKTLSMNVFTKKAKLRNPRLIDLEQRIHVVVDYAQEGDSYMLEILNILLIREIGRHLKLACTFMPAVYDTRGETTTERLVRFIEQNIGPACTYMSGAGGLNYLQAEYIPQEMKVMIQDWLTPPDKNSIVQLIAQDSEYPTRLPEQVVWKPFTQ